MKIEIFTSGGQFPYQAEGLINDIHFFYYRARDYSVSLDVFEKREDLKKLDNGIGYAQVDKNSYVSDEEAIDDIIILYNSIFNSSNELKQTNDGQ